MPRRRARPPELFDTGARLLGRHVTVIIVGEGSRRRARVLDIIQAFPPQERQAADMLRGLWEQAQFSSYARSRMDGTTGSNGSNGAAEYITDSACHARTRLDRIATRLDRRHWAVLWHRLLFEGTDRDVALRLGIGVRAVRPLLQAALQAVARLR